MLIDLNIWIASTLQLIEERDTSRSVATMRLLRLVAMAGNLSNGSIITAALKIPQLTSAYDRYR